MLGRGFQSAARSVYHRHRIFHGDRLRTGRLKIDLRTPQTGKNERLFPDQQMRTIELGGDVHCKIEVPHRLECDFRIRHRNSKITAKTYQGFRSPIPDRLDSFDRVVALVAWRLEPEHARYAVEKLVVRNFGNADRAISLHIRVAAQRRNAGALAPDVAAEHQQIGDLLHIAGSVTMLGDPHAVIDDDPLRVGVDNAYELDI